MKIYGAASKAVLVGKVTAGSTRFSLNRSRSDTASC